MGALRRRIDVAPVLLQQLDRRGAGGAEEIVREAEAQVNLVAFDAIAEVAIETADGRGAKVAKAIVVGALQRAVKGEIAALLAIFETGLDAAERAAGNVELAAGKGEPVLHPDVEGAAERIEAEGGIIGDHVHAGDGEGR